MANAVVVIKGRNLQLLDRDLADGAIGEVRVFDPKRHPDPSDPTQPFIDTITITTESRKAMLEADMVLITEINRH